MALLHIYVHWGEGTIEIQQKYTYLLYLFISCILYLTFSFHDPFGTLFPVEVFLKLPNGSNSRKIQHYAI
jgi:hypothetical protein